MLPFVECPQIEIDLDKPFESRYDDVPAEVFENGRRLLKAVMNEIPTGVKYLAGAIRLRTKNRFHKEARTLAGRVNADWREVMLANISYDLALAVIGCSTVVLPTSDGPVLARNMDWWPEDILAQTSCLVRYVRQKGLAFANAGWPGTIGAVTGMSGQGFGIALNAVLGPERTSRTGYPVLLHIRRVLEDADGFESAVRMLSGERLATSCLLTVVGTQNHQRVVIERTPKRAMQRWPEDGHPLVATNDYRLMFKPEACNAGEIYETTCLRYDSLQRLFAGHRQDQAIEDSALLYILSDPSVIQSITAQHVIVRPRSQEIRLLVPRHLVEAHDLPPENGSRYYVRI